MRAIAAGNLCPRRKSNGKVLERMDPHNNFQRFTKQVCKGKFFKGVLEEDVWIFFLTHY